MYWILFALSCAPTFSPAAPPAEAAATSLSALNLVKLDGTAMPAAELAGKVVLFVNVASKCGYTPQYEGLEALYKELAPRGLVIVGVPCNQFAGQEPGKAEEIATFCRMNYGVTFPLLEKQEVNGAGRSELYQFLVGSEAGGGTNIGWNFEKFLVNRDGKVVGRYSSKVTPEAPELSTAIEAALGK